MALTFATTLANHLLDALRAYVDSTSGTIVLNIYGGTAPANVTDNFDPSQCPLLAHFELSKPSAASAVNKTITLVQPSGDDAADASGTATFFRLGTTVGGGGGTSMIQGTVTDTSGNGDLKLNSTSIQQGQPATIVEAKFMMP